MSNPSVKTSALESKILALQEELASVRNENADLNERLKAYSSIHLGQTSFINKLIDKVPFGVILVNEEYIISHVNTEAENIFSMPESQLKGMDCNKLLDISKIDSDNITEKKITRLDNGKYIMHSTFVSDEGSHSVFVINFIDISEIKLAEQELIKINQVKDEFLNMISHELRTPLNVIQGYSSLLEEEVRELESTAAVSYIEQINNAGEKLLHMVSNLLDLSDLTAGKIKVDVIPISIEIIVTQLQYRLEKDLVEEGNKLIFKHNDIPSFEQDLALLMKILYELLANANKFTEAGVITVNITLKNENNNDWLCFEISDTGCGMTEETIKQIFDAFHQSDSTLTRSYDGLGLGLSLVEKMVKMLKGNIDVSSEIGKGSTFILQVPFQVLSET